MRIWEFSPANGTVSVRSYSPTLDKYETDADSEFTIEVDLRGCRWPVPRGRDHRRNARRRRGFWGKLEVADYDGMRTSESMRQARHHAAAALPDRASAAAARELDTARKEPPRRKRPRT